MDMVKVFCVGLLFSCSSLYAAQQQTLTQAPKKLTVSNNEVVQVALSSNDLNRLVVVDDSVASIHCPATFCTMDQNQDTSGGIAFSIGNSSQSLNNGTISFPPFTIYVDTENGYHFSILAVPVQTRGQTVLFTIKDQVDKKREEKYKSTAHADFLVDLMNSVISSFEENTYLEGYQKYSISRNYIKCDDSHSLKLKDDQFCLDRGELNAMPVMGYHNGRFNIIVYKLFNDSPASKSYIASKWYVRGLMASTIEPNLENIPAMGYVYMYQIVDGRGTGGSYE